MEDFSFKEIHCLIELCNFNPPKYLNYSILANQMGFSQHDKRFDKIKKFLLRKRVIKEEGLVGTSKMIKLDKDKLDEEIPEIAFIRFYEENFRYRFKQGFEYR